MREKISNLIIISTCVSVNHQCQVNQKLVNAYPGFEVGLSINLSCIKMFSFACVLCSSRFFKLECDGQTI